MRKLETYHVFGRFVNDAALSTWHRFQGRRQVEVLVSGLISPTRVARTANLSRRLVAGCPGGATRSGMTG